MKKDAVVLEVRGKMAVILASDGRFLRIRNRNYHAGQRIAEAEQTPVRLRPLVRRTLIIAACLVLALGSSAVAASKYMVWSYAGLDVGDISVNYTLNFRNEVLRAEGNSEEAEQLMESLEKVPYEPIDSAVERMIDAVEESQAEDGEKPEIAISVASFLGGTEGVESRVMEGVDRSIEKNHPEETREERQNEIRLERLEWQDAGRHMEERHLPQGTPEAQQPPAESEPHAQAPEEAKGQPEGQQPPAESEPQAQGPEEPKGQPEAQQPPAEAEPQAPEEPKDQPDGQQAETPQASAEASPPDAPAGGNPQEQGGTDGYTGEQPQEPPDQGGAQPAQPQEEQKHPQEQQAQPQGQPPDSHGPGEPGGGGAPPGQP